LPTSFYVGWARDAATSLAPRSIPDRVATTNKRKKMTNTGPERDDDPEREFARIFAINPNHAIRSLANTQFGLDVRRARDRSLRTK